MAWRTASGDTTLTSTNWWTNTNTPVLHASTNTTVNATARFTGTFTAPNTTNAATGVWFYVSTGGTHTSIVVTLQEDIGGTSSWLDTTATATALNADIQSSDWLFFRFGTPYTFATTGANRYRYKVQAVGTTSNGSFGSQTSTSDFCFISMDDRTSAIGSSDQIWLAADNGSGTRTITVDGTTVTFGNYGDTLVNPVVRSLLHALYIGRGGLWNWDTTADTIVTCKGNVVGSQRGEWRRGTAASPLSSSFTSRFKIDMAATGDHGIKIFNNFKFVEQGTPKSSTTLWKTKYVSGTGTAASPLVTLDAVDWSVGDEIIVAATSNNATNYQETENRFIITKNSATSYVLSNTSGGAENALTYTHTTDAWVVNVQRNVVIESTNTARGWYLYNGSTIVGDIDIDWVRYETTGNGVTAGHDGISLRAATSTVANCDYSVCYRPLYRGWFFSTSKETATYTGLIVCNSVQTNNATGALSVSTSGNLTLNDTFILSTQRAGLQVSTSNANVFNRLYVISGNTSGIGTTTSGGPMYLTAGVNTFNNCEVHCGRIYGVQLNGQYGSTFNDCLFGTKGSNQIDLVTFGDTLDDATFNNCMFGSTTLISNYLNMLTGSEIRFHQLNQTINNHTWYTPYGSARSTGAGLVDTTVRTAGSLGARFAPEEGTTGFTWSFLIPSKANSITNFFGWFLLNAAFTGDASASARVELWLPGATSVSATTDLSKATNLWQAAVLSATNTSSTDGLAEIRVIGVTVTAAAYVYADDFYNAGDTVTSTDKVTGLDTWYKGKPVQIIQPQATSAADIWTFPTVDLDTAGTTGKTLKDVLTVGKFLGLK